jgi:hypothetical protein
MEINILQYLACSVAAYEYNNNEIKYHQDIPASSQPAHWSNKELLCRALGLTGLRHWSENIPVLPITADHLAKASVYRDAIKDSIMLEMLANKSQSRWNKQVYGLLDQETISEQTADTFKHIAVFLPSMATKIIAKQARADLYRTLPSKHQGKPGEKITIHNMEILEEFYSSKHDTFCSKAKDEQGNLYLWYSKKEFGQGQIVNISGKIKKHTKEYHSNMDCTQLNYVEVLKNV